VHSGLLHARHQVTSSRAPGQPKEVFTIKSRRTSFLALITLVCLVAFAGTVFADQVIPATPETQGISTVTSANVVGAITETDAIAWTTTTSTGGMTTVTSAPGFVSLSDFHDDLANQVLANGGSVVQIYPILPGPGLYAQFSIPDSMLNQEVVGYPGVTWSDFIAGHLGSYTVATTQGGLHSGVINPGEVRYTTTYDKNVVATGGQTTFLATMNTNTGNKVIGQSNLDAKTNMQFITASEGGMVVGSENILIDGAGNTTSASDRMLCPFSYQPVDIIPAYCNIVQQGSSYQLNTGSVVTSANNRFVGTDATMPVVQNYAINVKGITMNDGATAPALGSVSSYIKAHIQEARGENVANVSVEIPFETPVSGYYLLPAAPSKAYDFSYSETSMASGIISQFSKSSQYQSGKALLPG